MSYIEIDSRELEEVVLNALSAIDVARTAIKNEAIANERNFGWNRFWWKFFKEPTDNELWESISARLFDFKGFGWKYHTMWYDQRELGPKLLVAAKHAKTVRVSVEDLAMFSNGKNVINNYRNIATDV